MVMACPNQIDDVRLPYQRGSAVKSFPHQRILLESPGAA
jgi:hypothetical protein